MTHVSSPTPSSLVTTLADLADMASQSELSPTEARMALDTLLQVQPNLSSFIARKGLRLPEAQQQALLRLLRAAEASEYVQALQCWVQNPALSLSTRALAITVLDRLGAPTDATYQQAIQEAEIAMSALRTADPASLTDEGALQPPWRETVQNLPLALALDLARELTAEQPYMALAVLQTLQLATEAQERMALVDSLAAIPLPESAAILQDMLAETPDKAAQKTIRKALHRLKAHGVAIDETSWRGRSVVGAVTHRLEMCLASHIDSAGDRLLWMVRTKPFGGYNVAYLVINYGTGIQHALGFPASKRELPELLEKVQSQSPLIELEPTYCQFQVAQAHQMNLATGAPVPEDYFALRDIVGETNVTFDKAIVYSALSEADLQEAAAYEHHASDLLDVPEFAGWTLPLSILQKYGDELRDIEESQIVVSEMMQRDRMNAVHEQALEEALGEESRRIMRLQLEEMAYYLLQTGRRLEALWAVAAARSLQEESPERLRRNPFAGALLDRSLESAKRNPGRNIILPFSQPSRSQSQPEEPSRIII